MALKGLDIFKLSPKKNCKECGSPTCMAFCMKVAQGAVALDKCPYFSEEAKAKLSERGFACKTVGSGDTVTDQTPAGGAIVPGSATILLYLGEEKPDAPVSVPNVVGLTAAEANQRLTSAGLILKVAGATASSSGNVHAVSQSVAAGTEVAAGTVITVRFSDGSVTD